MTKRFLICVFTFLSVVLLFGQQLTNCADEQAILPFLRQHLSQSPAQARTDQFVPITFHIIGDDNGNTLVRYSDIYETVCQTNTYFEDSGLQFYVHSIGQPVNSDILQEAPELNHHVFDALKHPYTLNMFIVSEELFIETGILLYHSYTDIQSDFILMDWRAVQNHSFFLAHQLGHTFKLMHPYREWTEVSFAELNNYYDITGQLPAVATVNGMLVELADGSNCETTGDFLCDTPPDYLFGVTLPDCPEDILVLDANNIAIPWMPGNIMGSFTNCPSDTYYFSDQQMEIMYADYLSPERDFLRELPTPTLLTNDIALDLLLPIDGEDITCNYLVKWEKLPNISLYVLELSLLPIFNIGFQQYMVEDTTFQFDMSMLEENRTYYWRVWPVANGLDCTADHSETFSFTVPYCDVATQKIQEMLRWKIRQNPCPQGKQSLLILEMETTTDLSINLHSTDGRLWYQKSLNLQKGLNTIDLPTESLPSGIYIVSLRKNANVYSKKLVIT